jgi:hypothetical protein
MMSYYSFLANRSGGKKTGRFAKPQNLENSRLSSLAVLSDRAITQFCLPEMNPLPKPSLKVASRAFSQARHFN